MAYHLIKNSPTVSEHLNDRMTHSEFAQVTRIPWGLGPEVEPGQGGADPVAQPSHQRSRIFSSLCSHLSVGFIWEIVALMVIGMAASSGWGYMHPHSL